MRSLALLAAPLAALPAAVAAQTLPAGVLIEDGAVADVTPAGFAALSEAMPALAGEMIGDSLVVDDMVTSLGEYLGCSLDLGVTGIAVDAQITDAEIHTQSPNRLTVDIDLILAINDSASPFSIDFMPDGWWCSWLSFGCEAYVDPTAIHASASFTATLVDGALALTLVSLEQDLADSLEANDLHLPGCDVLESLLDLAWSFLLDYLTGFVEDSLGDVLAEALAGAIPPIAFEGETELLDTTLSYSLVAGSLAIGNDTLRLGLDATFDAPPASCVEAFDPGGSEMTGDGTIPGPFSTIPSTGQPFALDVLLDDDLGNNALYVLWRGGVLCYTVDEDLIGFSLGTAILASLLLDQEDRPWFTGIWDDVDQPILIRTLPTVPPTIRFGGSHAADAYIESLDLEFFAWTRDRWARIVSIRTDITAGLDFDYDVTTGALGILVDLDTSAIQGTVVYNEMRPWLNEGIESHFGAAIGALVDPLIGSLLGDLAFTIPAVYGIKLSSVQVEAVGGSDDWAGLFANLTYDPALAEAGCDSSCEDGCDSGCGGGCDAQATPAERARAAASGSAFLLAFGSVFAWRRRR